MTDSLCSSTFGNSSEDTAIPGDARYQSTQQQRRGREIVRYRKSTLMKCNLEEATQKEFHGLLTGDKTLNNGLHGMAVQEQS